MWHRVLWAVNKIYPHRPVQSGPMGARVWGKKLEASNDLITTPMSYIVGEVVPVNRENHHFARLSARRQRLLLQAIQPFCKL